MTFFLLLVKIVTFTDHLRLQLKNRYSNNILAERHVSVINSN